MPRHNAPLDIAVIGTGIAGMSAAWLLSGGHRVTVYEQADRLGGHSNTVDVPGPVAAGRGGHRLHRLQRATYPNLTALFRHLDVATKPSEMSFAVSLRDGALEYAGTDLRGLFAQRRNLVRPRFWRCCATCCASIARRRATWRRWTIRTLSLRALSRRARLRQRLRRGPSAADGRGDLVDPGGAVGDYPAAAFIRFCDNHGLLQVRDRPIWRTVAGGSRRYVARLTAPFARRVRLGCGVRCVRRLPDGVLVADDHGRQARFDHVVIAAHADQALAMLADPSGRRGRAARRDSATARIRRCCTPMLADAAAPRRVVELELPRRAVRPKGRR